MKIYIFSLLSIVLIWSCGNKSTKNTQNGGDLAGEETKKEEKLRQVKITTDLGDIMVSLYNDTPIHRDNFLKLAKEGTINGSVFHRVIEGFMIQGGDPTTKDPKSTTPAGQGGPGYDLKAEIKRNHIHKNGALAAARLGDQMNPERKSSGSQFYIVNAPIVKPEDLAMMENYFGTKYTEAEKKIYFEKGGRPDLDMQYTVFGEVTSGMDVIQKIAAVKKGAFDRPVKDIKIQLSIVE